MALHGHEENLNPRNDKNVGNFLALIKLITQFDPLLAKHVQHAEQNPGSVSYLSPEIQNEFIHILASTVKSKLLRDIRKSKYYGILLDSTPDLGHRKQLSQIIRFVDVNFQTKQQEMSTRFSRLKDLNTKFGFLLDVKTLLSDTDEDAIRRDCTDFANFYDTDINGHELFTEIGDCRMLLSNRTEGQPETPLALLGFIVSFGDDVFPNLRISLEILLTIPVSIASCERSFSKLKLILSYSRASMGQNRLSDLALHKC